LIFIPFERFNDLYEGNNIKKVSNILSKLNDNVNDFEALYPKCFIHREILKMQKNCTLNIVNGKSIMIKQNENEEEEHSMSFQSEGKNSEEKFVRTGKKEIIKAQINLGKYVIDEQSKNTEFSEFEIEHMETKLSSLFLPININKIYAYELEKTIITRDFVAEKDGIILSQKEKLYLTIPANILVESEDVDIIEISDGYIINVYLSSVVNLRYS
jgi:hypothetical protein